MQWSTEHDKNIVSKISSKIENGGEGPIWMPFQLDLSG